MENQQKPSKAMLWTGRVISIVCILFLFVDAIMKVMESAPSMKGSIELGWPADGVRSIGLVLLLCTILYCIPRTAILGAILLTGYLGGAVAVMVMASVEGHPYLFPIIFGVLVWAGVFLQNEKLRALMPITRTP